MAAENPKITEALGGAMQIPQIFHELLSDMAAVLMNAAGPRLSSAVLPGFHGNAAAWTSHWPGAALCIPALLCWAQGALSEAGGVIRIVWRLLVNLLGPAEPEPEAAWPGEFHPQPDIPQADLTHFLLVFDQKGHMCITQC